jgi:pyridoxal phosphate phosphatase PHOSPHO2
MCELESSHRALIVLDFDWTVINSNSDTDVVEAFATNIDECRARLKEAGSARAWTNGMNTEMGMLHGKGTTVQEIEEYLMSIKIERELSDAIKLASASGAIIHILSDANTWFIDVILRANGLSGTIARVCSNPVEFERGRVRILPFHTSPHPDPESTSPPNLCKGRVMEEWLRELQSEFKLSTVIYAGDGSGDFEGAMRVPQGGFILARKDWSLHKSLAGAADKGQGPQAETCTWETQVQLAAMILVHLGISTETLGH